MFRKIIVAMVCIGFSVNAYSDLSAFDQFKASPDEAVIFAFRQNWSPPQSFKPMIYLNEREVTPAYRGRFVRISLKEPGKYVFKSSWTKARPIELDLSLGQVVIIEIASGMEFAFFGGTFASATNASAESKPVTAQAIATLALHSKYNGRVRGWYENNEWVHLPSHISLDPDAMLEDINTGFPADVHSVAMAIRENRIKDERFLPALKSYVDRFKDTEIEDNQLVSALYEVLQLIKLSSPEGIEYLTLLPEVSSSRHVIAHSNSVLEKSSSLPLYVELDADSLSTFFETANWYDRRLALNYLTKEQLFSEKANKVVSGYIEQFIGESDIDRKDFGVLHLSMRYAALSNKAEAISLVERVQKEAKYKRLQKKAKSALKWAAKRQ